MSQKKAWHFDFSKLTPFTTQQKIEKTEPYYSVLLSSYSFLGEWEDVDRLVQEIDENIEIKGKELKFVLERAQKRRNQYDK